jgi:aminoglycoside phosphotransferase family enzyme/predicted kinase
MFSPAHGAAGQGDNAMLNVTALLTPENYTHPVKGIELLETHISWVILTGDYAYKIKKPVNFGFLDFSTLAQRRHYCEEELRLNQRLAPDMYLEVVPVRGRPEAPGFNIGGEVIDYAVKMRQFPQAAQLDRILLQNGLQIEYLDAIAEVVAKFHLSIQQADPTSEFGKPEQIWQPVTENFSQIQERETNAATLQQLDSLYRWSLHSFEQLKPVFEQRKRDGFVRECHGDLHLRNIAWFENKPIIFDCIEFNPNLRWIDVISDLAFLFMDLIDRGQSTMAYRLLDRYLVHTGDYAGLRVLPFYFVYRAMVRAKVDSLRLAQSNVSAAERLADEQEFAGYLNLANTFVARPKPFLMITWGLSASGKSTISAGLLEMLGAIRLRSDVERKRLAGIDFMTRAKAEVGDGIYTPQMSERTYAHLLQLAEAILTAGFPVIVDAAFLDAARRTAFAQLAQQMKLPFVILQCMASTSSLRERICQRQHDASDADLAILEHQLSQVKPLSSSESSYTIAIDTEQDLDLPQLVKRIKQHATETRED